MRRTGLSIAGIVTIGLAAATTLLLGTLGAIGYDYIRTRQWEEFRQERSILADQLSTSLTLPLWNFDRAQIGKIIESTMPDEDLYALVVRSAGAPATVYARVRDEDWTLKEPAGPIATAGLLEERRSIVVADDTLGELRLFMTPKFVEARLQHALVSIVVAIGLFDLGLIAGLYLLLWRTVLRPLREVEQYAVAVSASDLAGEHLKGRKYWGELESLRQAVGTMVSMLKERYAEVQKSEARYRLLAENVGDVIWTLDPAGRFTYVSPSVERLLGYGPEAVLRLTIEQLLTPASATALRALLRDLVSAAGQGRRGESGRIELETLHRNGTRVWAENSYECLHGPAGELTGILGVCRDITERKGAEAERERSLRREHEARKEFTRKLIASQEAERRRIASELHDSLGQNLLLIKNRAQLALRPAASPAELGLQVEGIAELASQAIAEVRQISHDLRPYQLDQLGLTRALRSMIDSAAQSTAIVFKCKLEEVDDVFSDATATEFYRIVQESLNNILKHSAARHVHIDLERDVHQVRLWIEDDGRGFNHRAPADTGVAAGFGLQNLAERVGLLGGKLTIDSAPGGGTRVEVTIAIPDLR